MGRYPDENTRQEEMIHPEPHQRPDMDDIEPGFWYCEKCRSQNSELDGECQWCDPADDADHCTNTGGHEFVCTGTAYGGDDESYHGEGRCYCIHCGADGDG